MALSDILEGKVPREIPPDTWIMMFCTVFHKMPQEIENISERDFMRFAPMVKEVFTLLTAR